MLPVCHEDTWPALHGRWSWKLWGGRRHAESVRFEATVEVHDLPPFLSHLLFMISYHCVSRMDFLGLLIFINSKKVLPP